MKADPGTQVEIRAGDRLLAGAGEEAQGGRRFRLPIPPGFSPLTVRLRRPDGTRSPPWSLALAPPELPAWWNEITGLFHQGRREEIRRRLEQIDAQSPTKAPRRGQGLLLRSLALQALDDGRDEAAAAYLERGIAADRAQGGVSGEVEKRTLLARIDLDHGRFAAARRALSALPAGAPADAAYQTAYYQGLLSERVGDYRSALEQLRRAADLAERMGRSPYRWKAEQVLARILQSIGRSREAAKLYARLRADPNPETPCDVGGLLTNQAWSRLLAREAGEEADDPTPALAAALTVFEREGCRPEQRLNARLNLALAQQQAGRRHEARQVLEQAVPLVSQASLRDRLWWLDLEGREAIAEDHPALALPLYDELAALAERSLSPEGRFRAAVGRAKAHLALEQRAAAIADLAKADRLIDEQSLHIPAYEGRDTFVAQREAATRLYLQLLLDAGERQRAFALARRARSRLLRQLTVRDRLAQLTPAQQQRWDQALSRYWELRQAVDRQTAQEWQLPGDQVKRDREDRASQLAAARQDLDRATAAFGDGGDRGESSLSPPAPREVILAYHPLPRGWVGFAAHGQAVEVTTFALPAGALPDPAVLARLLLEPFRQALAAAERVRVLPYGSLRPVDFHTLALAGEPLLARHLVVYSLDLPARPTSPAPPGRPVALLVADPEGDLPAARQEATAVATAIRAWGSGWTLERLEGTDARAETMREALRGADLFHFAGHGNFAGLGGWDSALRLADGSRLTPGGCRPGSCSPPATPATPPSRRRGRGSASPRPSCWPAAGASSRRRGRSPTAPPATCSASCTGGGGLEPTCRSSCAAPSSPAAGGTRPPTGRASASSSPDPPPSCQKRSTGREHPG